MRGGVETWEEGGPGEAGRQGDECAGQRKRPAQRPRGRKGRRAPGSGGPRTGAHRPDGRPKGPCEAGRRERPRDGDSILGTAKNDERVLRGGGGGRDGIKLHFCPLLVRPPCFREEPRGPKSNESQGLRRAGQQSHVGLTSQKDEGTPGHVLGEEVPAWKTQRQAAREAAGQAYPQDGPGPEPGLPFSVNVSTRTQSPLTATTKSAIDKTAVDRECAGGRGNA